MSVPDYDVRVTSSMSVVMVSSAAVLANNSSVLADLKLTKLCELVSLTSIIGIGTVPVGVGTSTAGGVSLVSIALKKLCVQYIVTKSRSTIKN